jgi:hypothetical protein
VFVEFIIPVFISCQQPQTYVKLVVAFTVFELLMMGGVSLETG